jgi:hypothetical protein
MANRDHPIRSALSRILHEPLVGFALASALLFALQAGVGGGETPVITVDGDFIKQLVAEREMVLERKLEKSEIDSVVEGFIDQEVLIREAMVRRLYLNDGQVRHRLADKMFYLLGEPSSSPTEHDLQQFYRQHRERYRTPARVTFTHHFFGADRDRARRALVVGDGPPRDVGERFYMGKSLELYAAQELVPIFGNPFTRALEAMETGVWTGPVRSSRGWHLVRIDAWVPPEYVPPEVLGRRLATDWQGAALQAARRRQLDKLRAGYAIEYTGF